MSEIDGTISIIKKMKSKGWIPQKKKKMMMTIGSNADIQTTEMTNED